MAPILRPYSSQPASNSAVSEKKSTKAIKSQHCMYKDLK